MEHSALHALELIGQVIALGAVFLILALVLPAQRALRQDPCIDDLARALSASAARSMFRGALIAALATFLNLFVQVAEMRAKTVFNGVNLALVGAVRLGDVLSTAGGFQRLADLGLRFDVDHQVDPACASTFRRLCEFPRASPEI